MHYTSQLWSHAANICIDCLRGFAPLSITRAWFKNPLNPSVRCNHVVWGVSAGVYNRNSCTCLTVEVFTIKNTLCTTAYVLYYYYVLHAYGAIFSISITHLWNPKTFIFRVMKFTLWNQSFVSLILMFICDSFWDIDCSNLAIYASTNQKYIMYGRLMVQSVKTTCVLYRRHVYCIDDMYTV